MAELCFCESNLGVFWNPPVLGGHNTGRAENYKLHSARDAYLLSLSLRLVYKSRIREIKIYNLI